MDRRNFLKAAATAGAVLLPSGVRAAPSDLRSVEVYHKGQWRPGTWPGLKKDMIFRLRETDGSLVNEGTDSEVCIAYGEAQRVPSPENWVVNAEAFTFVGHGHVLFKRVQVMKDGQQVPFVRVVDLKHGLMHRWQKQIKLDIPAGYVLVPIEEAESFDYIKLLPG